MSKQRRTIGLLSFLRGSSDPNDGTPGCSNYDHEHGGCLLCWTECNKQVCVACERQDTRCRVEQGQRCAYFEKAVLPTAWQIDAGESILDQYQGQTKAVIQVRCKEARRCTCGEPLKPRKRFCDKCRQKRRKEAYRQSKQKTRIPKCVAVHS